MERSTQKGKEKATRFSEIGPDILRGFVQLAKCGILKGLVGPLGYKVALIMLLRIL